MVAGRKDDSVAMVLIAHRMDPLSPLLTAALGMILHLARRHDEAIDYLRAALDIDPDFFLLHRCLAANLMQRSLHEEAVAEMKRAVTLSGRSTEMLAALAHAYAIAGMHDDMRTVVAELREQSARRYARRIASAAYMRLRETTRRLLPRWSRRATSAIPI
jgi:predicted Zn-dependent protease